MKSFVYPNDVEKHPEINDLYDKRSTKSDSIGQPKQQREDPVYNLFFSNTQKGFLKLNSFIIIIIIQIMRIWFATH